MKLAITRGLPASGKTTRAKTWVAEDPTGRARVNRDDFRAMLHGGYVDQERQINAVRDAAITALLKRGIDVVADDTSLPNRAARDLRRLATLAGADFEVWDLTDVPVEECIRRDAGRAAAVGEKVIRDFHTRYLAGKPYPLPLPDEDELHAESTIAPYVAPEHGVDAVMVDIDGTVALMTGRSPFDETRVHEDRPNAPVIELVRLMAATRRIIFCSGRTDACRDETSKWLLEHVGVPYELLLMRAAGDMRKDAVVKMELFDAHIRDLYRVAFVLDDRDQVVRMWRSLGLTVLQVAEGNF